MPTVYVIGWISKQFRDFVSFFIDLDQHLGVQHPNAEQTTQHLKTQNSKMQNHKHVPFKSKVFSRPKCCPMTNYMCKIYLNALFLFQIFVNLNFKKLLKNRNHEIGAGQLIMFFRFKCLFTYLLGDNAYYQFLASIPISVSWS